MLLHITAVKVIFMTNQYKFQIFLEYYFQLLNTIKETKDCIFLSLTLLDMSMCLQFFMSDSLTGSCSP